MLNPALAAAMLHSGLLILLGLVLTWRVIAVRRGSRIGLGDGGDKMLLRRIRVHANFVETAPFIIAVLTLLALAQVAPWAIHALGAAALIGRIAHAIGLSSSAGTSMGRVAGMIITLTVLGGGALALIALSIAAVIG